MNLLTTTLKVWLVTGAIGSATIVASFGLKYYLFGPPMIEVTYADGTKATLPSNIRTTLAALTCHVATVFFWPISYVAWITGALKLS